MTDSDPFNDARYLAAIRGRLIAASASPAIHGPNNNSAAWAALYKNAPTDIGFLLRAVANRDNALHAILTRVETTRASIDMGTDNDLISIGRAVEADYAIDAYALEIARQIETGQQTARHD